MSDEMVTISRAEYEALLDRVEDAEDMAAIAAHRAKVEALGKEAVYRNLLPAALVNRLVAGEHPLRIWREHRGLTGIKLGDLAGVPQSYISEIELGRKPGSIDAVGRLAQALDVMIDDLLPMAR